VHWGAPNSPASPNPPRYWYGSGQTPPVSSCRARGPAPPAPAPRTRARRGQRRRPTASTPSPWQLHRIRTITGCTCDGGTGGWSRSDDRKQPDRGGTVDRIRGRNGHRVLPAFPLGPCPPEHAATASAVFLRSGRPGAEALSHEAAGERTACHDQQEARCAEKHPRARLRWEKVRGSGGDDAGR
jgi:hypothetical protein